MAIKRTTCTMDCPDSCALEVTVEDGRVIKLNGSYEHPNTQGYICSKISRFARRVYSQDRLLYPMRRSGPKGSDIFSQISWPEAIGEIVDRFQRIMKQFGPEAILPYHYGGSNGLLGDDSMDAYFFARLGASRIDRTLCAAPTTAIATEMYGKMPGVAYQDYVHAKCIIIWGANPKVSHIHLAPYLKQAKKNGAFIITIDPRRNFSQNEIDLHLPIRPGTDLILALAVINYLAEKQKLDTSFLNEKCENNDILLHAASKWDTKTAAQICGLSREDIICFADKFSSLSPAVIRCGWGVERNKNGGQAVAAILALPALLNKFGVRGGGYTLSNSGALKLDMEKVFGTVSWQSRKLNMTQLGRILNGDLSPPIKGIFVFNCNPLATVPDQNSLLKGFLREDLFTIVFEQVKTDTALYADILLPAVTFLEQNELKRGYGSYMLGGVQRIIEPAGEARSNEDVFAELGRAFGWKDAPFWWSSETYFDKTIAALDSPSPLPESEYFLQGKTFEINFNGSGPVQFETVWPKTASGKVNLCPEPLGQAPYEYKEKSRLFPYVLISPASSSLISSTLGEFNFTQLNLFINPQDAQKEKINTGDKVKVFNDLGEVICSVKITAALREGVVLLPKGAWRKASNNGQTATALCPDHVNTVAGGACYNDAEVAINKI